MVLVIPSHFRWYNIIAEHLFSQVNEEGNQNRLFKEIVGHRKNAKAIDKADQYQPGRNGRQAKKQTTAGWDLEVELISWLPLKELKETNTIETAQYAVHNMTDKEPAFDWWTRDVLKRKKRLMKMPQSRHKQSGFKFGIRIPRHHKVRFVYIVRFCFIILHVYRFKVY